MSESTPEAQPQEPQGDPAGDGMEPYNDVERVLVSGSRGELANNEVIAKLVVAPFFFLTATEPQAEDEVVQPLILRGPDGQDVLAIFTHPERAAQSFIDAAPYAVSINGANAIRQAGELGVAINPGHPIGLVLDPENVALVRSLLGTEED